MSREDDKNIQRAELARRREAKRLERERQIRQMKIKLVICMVLFVLIVVGITMLIVREATKKKDTDSKDKAIAAEAVDSDESGRKISDWSSVESAGDASLGTAGDALTDFDIDMSFVGDCCMASNLENNSYGTLLWYESNADTTYFFDGVRSYFENDDITVANCENTFSDSSRGSELLV